MATAPWRSPLTTSGAATRRQTPTTRRSTHLAPQLRRSSPRLCGRSAIVMRLARAGLRIEEFTEMPVPGIYDGLGSAASRLPAIYIVKAAKS